jgi:hypothetical protein
VYETASSGKIKEMRLRTAHLACVLLLVSSLGAAEGSTLRSGRLAFSSQYISMLLQQHGAQACEETSPGLAASRARTLHSADRAVYRTVWTMRPPSAHAAARHMVTATAV